MRFQAYKISGGRGFLKNAHSPGTPSALTLAANRRNFNGLMEAELRHPGESRGPEHCEKTGFRLSPE